MQVKCGDKFENEVVQRFNKCALSENNCVGKRVEDATDWPVRCPHCLVFS